jgi:hypothetical protein
VPRQISAQTLAAHRLIHLAAYSWRSPLLASAIGHPKFEHSGLRFAMHEALSNCGIMGFGNTRRFFFFAA